MRVGIDGTRRSSSGLRVVVAVIIVVATVAVEEKNNGSRTILGESWNNTQPLSLFAGKNFVARGPGIFFGQCCARCNNSGSHGVMLN